MNYQKIYTSIIVKAKMRNKIDGYKEVHHIIPKSLGGGDERSNLVELTAREHFVAHMCLALIHGGLQWLSMRYFKSDGRYHNSRLYEIARTKSAEATSVYQMGKKLSESHCQAISQALKGKKKTESHCMALKKPKSEHMKKALSASLTGKKRSIEDRKAMSDAHKGKPWSAARRAAHEKSKQIYLDKP